MRNTDPAQPAEPAAWRNYDDANRFQKWLRRFASSDVGSWLFLRVAHRLDKPVYKASRGRFTVGSLLGGLPIAMVTTTGRRSGEKRTVPVLGLPTSDGLAVISSSFGQERHPGWYYNLRADPTGEVAVGDERRAFHAVEAEGERRERIWEQALQTYPGFATYEKRAAHRRIAVWVLERTP
jgi:deazaflavin-dependent oxidoreductase (nitroreductase family)